jgi:hypothetical protein
MTFKNEYNAPAIAIYIRLAEDDFCKRLKVVGDIVSEIVELNGEQTIIIEDDEKRAFYAYRPYVQDLELIKVINK